MLVKNIERLIDGEYIKRAYEYACNHSEDLDTKSGCVVILRDGEIFYGTNRLPEGIELISERIQKPLKYSYLEHCERDAIAQVVKEGKSTKDATIYINWKPCMDCTRMIINSGFRRVVVHKEGQETYERLANIDKGGDWHEIDSMEFLREAGVIVDYESLDFKGTVIGRFRGQDFTL